MSVEIWYFCFKSHQGKNAKMSSFRLLPWKKSLVFCSQGSAPGGLTQCLSWWGAPSRDGPSTLCHCSVGSWAHTLNVLAEVVFSPSPTENPLRLPSRKCLQSFYFWNGFQLQTVPVEVTLWQQMAPCVFHNLMTWLFWPLFCPHLPFSLCDLEMRSKSRAYC